MSETRGSSTSEEKINRSAQTTPRPRKDRTPGQGSVDKRVKKG